jgi:hypothetical protein
MPVNNTSIVEFVATDKQAGDVRLSGENMAGQSDIWC